MTISEGKLIHKLPPEIHNKIAAGEVVQRPSSVVKELLDNAIDAGSTKISIVIENAGRTLIQVSDNGCGMEKEDIPLCFERHATSKIQDIEDIFSIHTLGFRGEAMASIASIAQVSLKSKLHEAELGFEYEIWGGEERSFKACAMESGTSISVHHLFYNVPARRSFLKTDATEFRHILTVVQQAVLANPNIAFGLFADGQEIYHLEQQSLAERIVQLFGKSYKASLIPFQEDTTYMCLHGYLIDPKLTKKQRGEQFLFVNGRPFQHRSISYIVNEIYKPFLAKGEYPFYAIFFELDSSEIDVNVHPSKMEIKFEDEKNVIHFTRSIIKKALHERYSIKVPSTEILSNSFSSDFSFTPKIDKTPTQENPHWKLPSRINTTSKQSQDAINTFYKPIEKVNDELELSKKPESSLNEKPEYNKDRGFWQLHDQFILSQTRTGLCVVDQYFAHRRILYEKALHHMHSGLPSSQQLLFAQQIELSATEFKLVKDLEVDLENMGFSIQLLSGNTALISGVPSEVRIGEEKDVLLEVIHEIHELRSDQKLNVQQKMAVALAKRTAIPRGKKLSQLEMEKLVDELFSCKEPMIDPLGKPTLRYIALDEIKFRFR